MRNTLKLLTASTTTVAALVFAAPAFAAYNSPTISIDNPSERIAGPASPLTINLTAARGDDPTFRIDIYIPQGYLGNVTPPAGTQIGTVRASAQSLPSPDIVVPLEGVIRTDLVENHAAVAVRCFGGEANVQSVWLIELTNPTGGAPVRVPGFLTTALSGSESSIGRARLRICLSPPGFGAINAKVFETRLTLTNLFTNPTAAGSYRWVARFTPYAATGLPNAAGTVEAHAIDTIPVRAQIRAGKYNKRTKRLAVSGTIIEAGTPLRVFVNVLLNGRRVARVRSNESGVFRASLRIRRKGRYTLRAEVVSGARTVQGCTAVLTPPLPCTRTVVSGFSVTSAITRVRVR